MIGLLFALLGLAEAGSLRATVRVDNGVATVLRAVPDEAAPNALPGATPLLGPGGEVLGGVALSPLTTLRSGIDPEGGHGSVITVPSPLLRIRLPDEGPDASLRRSLPSAQLPPPVGTPVALVSSGPSARRLDLVLFAEGYPAAEEAKFDRDADAIVRHLGEVEPWSRYAGLVNIWKVFVPSTEAGIDQPDAGLRRDTAFGCGYGCDLVGTTAERLICCDETLVTDGIEGSAAFADGVLMLINETRYGGSGGLLYSTAYTGDTLALQVAAHELGHSLLALWDEYGYDVVQPADQSYVSPNCAPIGGPLPWEAWIEDGPIDWEAWETVQEGKLTTPGQYRGVDCDGRDGAQRPGAICAYPVCSFTDWVRPSQGACMMHTLQDHYCPACTEAIIESLWEATGGALDAALPEPGTPVRLEAGESETFSVQTLLPDLEVVWTLGDRVLGTGNELVLDGSSDLCGTLTATVRDPTDLVRDDVNGALTVQATWDVSTGRCCGCATADPGLGPWLLMLPLGLLRRRRT